MSRASRIPVVCGVDIGSTNTKVVAMSESGSIVARAIRPTPRAADGLTIDAESLVGAIEDMVLTACGGNLIVHAASAAGVGEDGVLVDDDLTPLTPALAWFDRRRQGVFRSLEGRLGDDGSFDAGSDPARTIVSWAWATSHLAPGTRAASWVALADYVPARWAGQAFLSDTLASRTSAWRSTDRHWDRDRVELTLGSLDLLPPVLRAGDVIGGLVSPRLREAGIVAPDAVTVAGGHDHPVAGWAVDQMVPGALLDSMGTAEVVVAQSATMPAVHDAIDVAPGIASAGVTVLRVEELARNVQWASQDPEVARRIHGILDGSVAALPVFEEGFFLPGRRGGGQPSYSLDAPRDPAARASAVLGALALAGREAIGAVRAATAEGAGADVRLAGGWSRSPGWIDIKTAVNGFRAAPILEPQVTATGAALLAARALGWNPDPSRALGGFAVEMLS